MKVEISLPFLTRGKPKRCNSDRHVYVTMPVTVEVPEVPVGDTEVAFETYERYALFADPHTEEHDILKVEAEWEMRAYDGRLYRKLFDVTAIGDAAFHIAFDDTTAAKAEDPGSSISTGFGYYGTNPLASAIRRQVEFDLEKTSLSDSNVVIAWPGGQGNIARDRARNATEFTIVGPSIENIDGPLCEKSMHRIEKQVSRLLVIGGDLWVESRPPSWRVTVVDNKISLHLATAIEGFDPILSRRHFPIDRLDEAREYARQCATPRASEDIEYTVSEYVVDYDAHLPELLEFDADAEELSRIGYALAFESMRYARRNHGWLDNLDGALKSSLFSAYEETMETDYLRGQMGEVGQYVEDLCTVWRRFHRPTSWCELGTARARFGDMLIKRARALAENAPITLGSGIAVERPQGMRP
ncbi:hypothetical protein OIU34_24315 [Pararhizobium sp. BT-229]|uniref:hypothetical protein n=1 Tax=Pararhizobium sp. BT-229 TaxID=2986923 RepID=UPI0021F70360|nr:hypothetical protein [Pararhizobium sp. BT-229]MCV9965025.1 hypothetical protein [Pararhizobium sp. BT-229]